MSTDVMQRIDDGTYEFLGCHDSVDGGKISIPTFKSMEFKMNKKNRVVRPLGQYGSSYLLSDSLYAAYQIFSTISYIIAGVLVLLQFVFPGITVNYLNLNQNLPLYIIFAVCVITLIVQLKIASLGQKINSTQADLIESSKKPKNAISKVYAGIVYLSGFVLAMLGALGIFDEVHAGRPLLNFWFALLFIGIGMPVLFYRKHKR